MSSQRLCVVLALTALLGGCAHYDHLSHRERSAAIGAGVGGIAGAAVSHGHVMGAIAGAAIGGVIGDHIGRHNDYEPRGRGHHNHD